MLKKSTLQNLKLFLSEFYYNTKTIIHIKQKNRSDKLRFVLFSNGGEFSLLYSPLIKSFCHFNNLINNILILLNINIISI